MQVVRPRDNSGKKKKINLNKLPVKIFQKYRNGLGVYEYYRNLPEKLHYYDKERRA